MNVFDFNFDWLWEDLAPRDLDEKLLRVPLHYFDGRSEHVGQKTSQRIFLEFDVFLSDAAIPLVDNDVLSSEVLVDG